MADNGITAEELATWLTPRQALNLIQQVYVDIGVAARAIDGRLRGGLIRSGAKSSSWGESGNPTSIVLIPANYWAHLAVKTADWWDTGDIRVFLPSDSYRHQSRTCRYFGVRFEPSGVQAIVSEAPKRLVIQPPPAFSAPSESNEVQETKGPPVSDAHLRQWYALYTTVFSEIEQTEDHARASAFGMFPGKSVTRAAIRKLRGAGTLKRGRKPTGNKG